ncbi:MAG: sterol desaturase family protein [Pirellulales bacterium]
MVRTAIGLAVGLALVFAGTLLVTILRDDIFSGRGFDASRYATFSAWWAMLFTPLGVLALTALYMAFECMALGYERSALRRLLAWESDESVQDDMFYFILSVSSLGFLAMTVLTLGFGYWMHAIAVRDYGLRLAEAIPPVPQFFVLVLVFTFLNYWQHRLNHYRAFWHIHKVHHSATSLTLLTPQRNHPINALWVNLTETLPIAMLGFDPAVYLTMRIINSLYQISVHSHLDWGGEWVRRYVLITPAMHWVHHSNKSRHWNTNFGIISLWDALFGTLYVPNDEEVKAIQFGITRDTLYNSPGRSRNMLRIYGRFLKHLSRDVGAWGRSRSAVGRHASAVRSPRKAPRTV